MLDLAYSEAPTDHSQFWKIIDEQIQFIDTDFEQMHLETEEEAKARSTTQVPLEYESWIFWYRKGDDRAAIEFYFNEMKSHFPKLKKLARKRELTPDFAFWLARIAFAHGFLMNNAFVLKNDLAHEMAGRARANDIEKKWLALAILKLTGEGHTRSQAEKRIVEFLSERKNAPPGTLKGADVALRKIAEKVLRKGDLLSTYDDKNFYLSKMKKAAKLTVEVPGLPKKF